MSACGQLGKNDMIFYYLEWDHFSNIEKTGIWSLCKIEGSRNVYKLPLKIIEMNR